MNPIDQIRKALEDHLAHNETSGIHLHTAMVSADALQALLASHDAAVQRVAELEKQVEAVTNVANAAMKGSAEMQERCATEAWNHFMEVCKRFGVPPTGREDWCAARAIRAIKE